MDRTDQFQLHHAAFLGFRFPDAPILPDFVSEPPVAFDSSANIASTRFTAFRAVCAGFAGSSFGATSSSTIAGGDGGWTTGAGGGSSVGAIVVMARNRMGLKELVGKRVVSSSSSLARFSVISWSIASVSTEAAAVSGAAEVRVDGLTLNRELVESWL